MSRSVKVCSTPGCPDIATPGAAQCPAHKPKPWAGSTRNQNRTTSGWEEQRRNRALLARRPRCYLCGQPATIIDHVDNLAAGGADTKANKAPICQPCHAAKTIAEAAAARAATPRG